jgi:hypothetical protein
MATAADGELAEWRVIVGVDPATGRTPERGVQPTVIEYLPHRRWRWKLRIGAGAVVVAALAALLIVLD